MEKNTTDKRIKFLSHGVLIAVCVCLAVALILFSLALREIGISKRINFLRQARSVELSFIIVVNEFALRNEELYDELRKSGLSKSAEEAVRDYSGFEGDIKVLKHDGAYGFPVEITLEKDGLSAVFTHEEGWKVKKNHNYSMKEGKWALSFFS